MAKTTVVNLFFICLFILASCGQEGNTPESAPSENTGTGVVSEEIPRLSIEPGEQFFLQPVGHLTDAYEVPENLDKDAVRSFIFVQPKDSLPVLRQYQRGDILELSLDEELTITARINRNQAVGQEGTRNLTASILDPHNGVFTLSIADSSMTGNIDLVSENRLFHIRYDSISGLHYLAEINRERLDVLDGSEPLEY